MNIQLSVKFRHHVNVVCILIYNAYWSLHSTRVRKYMHNSQICGQMGSSLHWNLAVSKTGADQTNTTQDPPIAILLFTRRLLPMIDISKMTNVFGKQWLLKEPTVCIYSTYLLCSQYARYAKVQYFKIVASGITTAFLPIWCLIGCYVWRIRTTTSSAIQTGFHLKWVGLILITKP